MQENLENIIPILVIEDDPNALRLIQFTLTEAGYITAGLPGGADGITYIQKLNPRVVILDETLPDADYESIILETRASFRAAGKPPPRFIFMESRETLIRYGNGMDSLRRIFPSLEQSQPDMLLVKPFARDELLAFVKRCLALDNTT